VRSGTHRLAIIKQHSSGNNTPSNILKTSELAIKGRSTSNGVVKPLKSAAIKHFSSNLP
jgi:hypothetical protein